MPLPTNAPTIECPVCALPHRHGAVDCDRCGQDLSFRPSLGAMRDELVARKRKGVFALVLIVLMVAANLAFFRGRAAFVLLAPIGWLLVSGNRYLVLRRRLALAASKEHES